MFSAQPIERLIFIGGQAKNTVLCQYLARCLEMPAQLGDPLSRIDKATLTGRHSDLQEGERHGDWAVAFGLSLGEVS